MSPEANPTFNQLTECTEVGLVRRAITRYLIPRNAEASIARHRRLGIPLVGRAIDRTISQLKKAKRNPESNYRIDFSYGRMEGVADFALRKSVFNEAWHAGSAVLLMALAARIEAEQPAWSAVLVAFSAGYHLPLVVVQRYNRARAVHFVDGRLQAGETFRADYQNWAGIDARAVQNFQAHQSGPESAPPPPNVK